MYMTISIDAEKAFDNIQHSFIIKVISKLGIEGNFQFDRLFRKKKKNSTAHIILNGEKLKFSH